ncbi:MAG: MFS transporter [Myxococcota bacterium]
MNPLQDPNFPFRPDRLPVFYGWVIVVVATAGIILSIPGQTMGVSVFTDDLISATGLSRLQISNAYLVGTLLSGLSLPMGGQLLDRFGARAMVVLASLLLGATLMYFSSIDAIAASLGGGLAATSLCLILGFVCLRFSGQGMLTVTSRTMLGKWFDKKRGRVAGTSGMFVSFGFSYAPLLLKDLVDDFGWRGAYWAMALCSICVTASLGWLFFRDNPEQCGLRMDGGDQTEPSSVMQKETIYDFDRGEAIRTRAFWALALGLGSHGLIMTGITFHILDIGAESGLSGTESVALFLPMAMVGAVVGTFVGFLAERVSPFTLLLCMMASMSLGILGFTSLQELKWLAVVGFGTTGGFFSNLSTIALPRWFGRLHLGAIGGFKMMCLVLATSIGPSLLATSKHLTGSYEPVLWLTLLLPATGAILSLTSRDPQGGVPQTAHRAA